MNSQFPRHAAFVRVTHWITAICFFALLVTGLELVVSHPRFYWGETGNANTAPLFKIPIPASRSTVPTGYGYVLADQNGWSRYLHFQAAWLVVLTGLVYAIVGLWTGHFRSNLFPAPADRSWQSCRKVVARHMRFARPDESEAFSYNVLQRAAYLFVIFVLFPLVIWTGLALSPAFDSAFPAAVNLLGGRQSARTLHFLLSGFLLFFLIVHIAMVVLAGFTSRVRAMITGMVAPAGEYI
jgi:thiosulfate reductase cytochrome b subunit